MTSGAEAALTGADAGDVLAAALATRGAELLSWSRVAVHARPGAETSVGFDAVTSEGRLYLVASTVELSPAQVEASRAVRLDSAEGSVHVWIHPADPMLTGLPTACEPSELSAALGRAWAASVEVARIEMLVHRPLRRAVVLAEASVGGERRTVYVKVVRPGRAEGLLARHAVYALAPRADDLGAGAVAIAAASGVPMTVALHRPQGADQVALDPALLDSVLASLPAAAVGLRRRPAVADRLAVYAAALETRIQDVPRVRALAARIADRLALAPDAPDVPTHGDLHPANVFVDSAEDPRRVTAVIDVDTLGPGRRADDLAAFLAHLIVLPEVDPVGYRAVPRVVQEHLRHAAAQVDEADLRARTAAHLIALASGTSGDVPARWLAIAEDVLDAAATG